MKIPPPANRNNSANLPTGPLAAEAAGEVSYPPDLQSRYFDICLIDFEADVFSSVYHNPAKFAPADQQFSLSEKLSNDLAELVHPDDAEKFACFLTPQALQKTLGTPRPLLPKPCA